MLLAILLLSLLGNSANATQATAKLLNGTIQVDSGNGLWTQGYPMVGVNSDTDYVPIAVDAFGNIIVSGGGGGGGGGSGDGAILDGINAALKATVTASHALKVDPSAVTQPISAASLPLPSGASQEHVAANSPNACRLSDGASFIATLPVSGAFFQTTQPVSIASMPSTPVTGPLTDTQLRATAVPISAAALPLPSGAATSANQTTTNTSLASIDGKETQYFTQNFGPIAPTAGPFETITELFNVDTAGYAAVSFQIRQAVVSGGGAFSAQFEMQARNSVSDVWESYPGVPVVGQVPSTPLFITFSNNPIDQGLITAPASARFIRGVIASYDNTGGTPGNSTYSATVYAMRNYNGYQPMIVANPPGQESMNFSQPVVIADDQSAIPVTGAFFQPTQPVSLATLPALSAGSAVIGHVINDASSAVIGHVINDASSAVIGHVIVDSAPSTAVTGPLTDTQLRASAVPTSLATLPALSAGSAVIGHVVVDTAPTTAVTVASLPLPSGAAQDASVTGLEVAQGSTTSGQNGALAQGAVTTGAPTYTTAKTDPLSLDTTGNLRVSLKDSTMPALAAGSAVIGHVIVDTTPTTAVTIASLPALTAGSAVIGHVINDASSAVIGHVIADSGSTTAVTGTVTANATLSAETTKVIGTVNVASGQTIGLAAGSQVVGHVINDASSAVIGHVIADSGSTTAVTGTVTVAEATTGGNPCLNPQATLVSITGATTTTNATQIIALSGTTKIYICSMTIIGVSGTSPTFSLVQGTGSNCVTSQTNVVQAWATTAGTLYAFANPVAVGVAGNELCYKDGGTSPVQNYQINYVQQ